MTPCLSIRIYVFISCCFYPDLIHHLWNHSCHIQHPRSLGEMNKTVVNRHAGLIEWGKDLKETGTNNFSGTFGFSVTQGTILSFPWNGSAYSYYDRRAAKIRLSSCSFPQHDCFDRYERWQRNGWIAVLLSRWKLWLSVTIIRPSIDRVLIWLWKSHFQWVGHQTRSSTNIQVGMVVCLLSQVPPEFWSGGQINITMFKRPK